MTSARHTPDATPSPTLKSAAADPALPETPEMAALLAHGDHVATLAGLLFQELAPEHGLDGIWDQRLRLAARLHDIGMVEGRKGHHKTGMRLIDSNLGLDIPDEDRPWVALLVRYHRKARPSTRQARFARLKRPDRQALARTAALLRLADALDYTHAGRISGLTTEVRKHTVEIAVQCEAADCEPELRRAGEKGNLFRHLFDKKLEFSCLPR